MLKVNNVFSYYGNACALHDVSFEINQGEIVSIIGANGAGKSTLMKTIMGVVKPRSGSIIYEGSDISRMPTHKIVKAGIVYVPEGRDVFSTLSVADNLEMGAYSCNYSQKEMVALQEEMYDMFPRLKERRKQAAGTLSGGEQQMVAIARGLMSRPKLIMFDEPSLGLAPIIVDEVFEQIKTINDKMKVSVILVEQNAYMALSISNRCYALENGQVSMQGDSKVLIEDDTIQKVYLGM
ncbi:MAG: ABC transporter ATP-binding protein [Lachnospiraceae bacterium]|nr:ABC transporter ATP-binding protein [Lachnospiraceae bacterium]